MPADPLKRLPISLIEPYVYHDGPGDESVGHKSGYISQGEFADLMHTTRRSVARWFYEGGIPITYMNQLCDVFKWNITELMRRFGVTEYDYVRAMRRSQLPLLRAAAEEVYIPDRRHCRNGGTPPGGRETNLLAGGQPVGGEGQARVVCICGRAHVNGPVYLTIENDPILGREVCA